MNREIELVSFMMYLSLDCANIIIDMSQEELLEEWVEWKERILSITQTEPNRYCSCGECWTNNILKQSKMIVEITKEE